MKPYGFIASPGSYPGWRYSARNLRKHYFYRDEFNHDRYIGYGHWLPAWKIWPNLKEVTRASVKSARQQAKKHIAEGLNEYMMYYHTSNYDPHKGEWVN